jgi:uncharacterized membrane protein YtjA (UPF0391 family)
MRPVRAVPAMVRERFVSGFQMPWERSGSLKLRCTQRPTRRVAMLHYAIVFFVIAIIAAVFGFTGIAAGAAEIAKILFYIFLVVFVVTLLLGVFRT